MIRGKQSLLFFYVLMGYIFIAFLWWMLLLSKISNESYAEKRDLLQLNYSYRNSNTPFEQSQELKQVEEERKRKVYMIFGEGSFFLAVLIVMTWMMHRTLRREAVVALQQKNFLLSITHELRSPIASSKVALQTLEKYRELPDAKRNTLLANSLHDMDRLQGLVENLLLAAKIEDHTFSIGQDICDLSEIVLQSVDKLKQVNGEDRTFELNIQPDVVVTGDRMGLTSVIINLIENAIKYSYNGSPISVSLWNENNHAVFRIADKGLGIPDGEKKKVFQKFYRVGHEETRKTKGTGLGLYIVKKILTLHRGSVTLSDNTPQGTIFEVSLPKTL